MLNLIQLSSLPKEYFGYVREELMDAIGRDLCLMFEWEKNWWCFPSCMCL